MLDTITLLKDMAVFTDSLTVSWKQISEKLLKPLQGYQNGKCTSSTIRTEVSCTFAGVFRSSNADITH